MKQIELVINHWIVNENSLRLNSVVSHFAYNDASETEITTACGKVILLATAKIVDYHHSKIRRCKLCTKSISNNSSDKQSIGDVK